MLPLKSPLDKDLYPYYCIDEGRRILYAFITPSKMYKIENIGSNKNPGYTIDHYITRNMVLRHWNRNYKQLNQQEFTVIYERIFQGILSQIIN